MDEAQAKKARGWMVGVVQWCGQRRQQEHSAREEGEAATAGAEHEQLQLQPGQSLLPV